MTARTTTVLGHCEACGENSFDWPRCTECGSVAIDYLHDRVKVAMAPVHRDRDPKTGNPRVAA